MIDALDALKLIRTQSLRQPVARRAVSAMTHAPVNSFKPAAAPKPDLFQKGLQQLQSGHPEVAPLPSRMPKVIRGAVKPSVQPELHKALLEKPAPSGGLGGLFQTLKTRFLPKVTPAPAQPAMNPAQKLRQAMQASKMQIAETAPKPAGASQNNPFRSMESVLLNHNMEAAGLKNPGLTAQAANGLKREANPKPATGLAAVTMPLTGVGLLTAPVAAPAAMVVKPALINPFVAKLPVIIP